MVGRYPSKLIYRKLYPCVGHSFGPAKVRVNFGTSDFVWKQAGQLGVREGDRGVWTVRGRVVRR